MAASSDLSSSSTVGIVTVVTHQACGSMEARFQPPVFNIKVVDGSNGIAAYESVPLGGGSVPSQYQGAGGGSNGSVGAGAGTGEPFKRKRGRPRKYGPDGKVILAVNPVSAGPAAPPTTGAFSAAANAAATAAAEGVKKARGRPPGSSKKKQLEALGNLDSHPIAIGFRSHMLLLILPTRNESDSVSRLLQRMKYQKLLYDHSIDYQNKRNDCLHKAWFAPCHLSLPAFNVTHC